MIVFYNIRGRPENRRKHMANRRMNQNGAFQFGKTVSDDPAGGRAVRICCQPQWNGVLSIDIFVNGVYVYDDKIVVIFNYKNGERCILFENMKNALKKENTHHNGECSSMFKFRLDHAANKISHFWIRFAI